MQLRVAVPIPGFDKIMTYELEQIDDFFYTLSGENISFTLIDPAKIREYRFDLPEGYAKKLEVEEGDRIKALAMMVLQEPIEQSMVNFLAPVVINETKGLVAQVVLDEQKYPDFVLAEPIGNYL